MRNENKALTTGVRYSAYGGKCQVCKKQLAAGGKWCQECAHVRGICYICGKQILETSMYTGHAVFGQNDQMSKKEIEAARPAPPSTKPKKVAKPDTDDLDMAEKQAAAAARNIAEREAVAAAAAAAAAATVTSAAPAASDAGAAPDGGAPAPPSGQGLGQEGPGQELDAFIEAATFTVPMAGYVFKQGVHGLGYYRDASRASVYSQHSSSLAKTGSESQARGQAQHGSVAAESWPKVLRTGGGWTELQGQDGRVYYYNASSGATQWEMPPFAFDTRAAAPTGNSVMDAVREQAAAQGGGAGSAGVWLETRSAEGHVYYYNTRTNETSWTNPALEARKKKTPAAVLRGK